MAACVVVFLALSRSVVALQPSSSRSKTERVTLSSREGHWHHRASSSALHCKGALPVCAKQQERAPTAEVIVSTFEEDLSWLADVDIGGNITVYVHDRSEPRTHYGISPGDNLKAAKQSQVHLISMNPARRVPITFVDIPNVGDEASAYLSHITAHYEHLPEVMFFVHGHRCAKHATADMAGILDNRWRCFRPAAGYETLNDLYNQHVCPDMSSRKWVNEKRVAKIRAAWELFEPELGPFPPSFCFDSYGQFVVSRQRVLSHPRDFYLKLLDGVKAGKTTMEWFWRMLFVPRFQ
mmetsp:Transcript_28078/g.65614  ORF Transcript_28078/g.65614 Transcript_28078/m.65614 type:complete len:294 (+) Transcript_28078:61-942(+)